MFTFFCGGAWVTFVVGIIICGGVNKEVVLLFEFVVDVLSYVLLSL
jgi:hypothetical protein